MKIIYFFINDFNQIPPDYNRSKKFNKFYNAITVKIIDENFLNFAQTCKTIFEENKQLSRSASHMLLEKVSAKLLEDQMLLTKARQHREARLNRKNVDKASNNFLDTTMQ